VAVRAGGERFAATRAVVSSLDARRLLLELVDPGAVPPWLAAEAGRIHVGRRNVSELKVDATLAAMPPLPGPPGFDGASCCRPTPPATWSGPSPASSWASCPSGRR